MTLAVQSAAMMARYQRSCLLGVLLMCAPSCTSKDEGKDKAASARANKVSDREKGQAQATPLAKTPASAEPEAEIEAPTEPLVPLSDEQLKEHAVGFYALKDKLLFAKEDEVAAMLETLGSEGLGGAVPVSWKPHMGELRTLAASSQIEPGIESAAAAFASITATCAACHQAHEVTPSLTEAVAEPEGLDFKDHMSGHKWALDRMWAGLATPSDELWKEGAAFLAGEPAHFRDLSSYGDDADAAIAHAERVHGLAAKAGSLASSDERAALFGEFIASCAGCHAMPASAPRAKEELFD